MKVSLDLRLFVEEDPAVTRREALAELGLAPSASDEDVKARWRDLVKVWQQETGGSDAEEIERLILARDAARSKGPCGPYLPWRGAHSPGAHSPRECAAGARPFAPKTPLRRIEPTHDISHRAFSPNYGKPRCGGPICGNRSAAPPRGSAVSRRGGDGNTKPIPVERRATSPTANPTSEHSQQPAFFSTPAGAIDILRGRTLPPPWGAKTRSPCKSGDLAA